VYKTILIILAVSLFLSLPCSYALSDKQQDAEQNKEKQLYDPRVIIVRFKDEVTTNQIEDFLKENNCKVRGEIKEKRIFYTVLLPEGITYNDVEEKFEKDKRVKYVSPDIYMEFNNSGIEFVNEIRQRSEEVFSSVGLYDENGVDALDLLEGNDNPKVIIAVLDTGISSQLQDILEELNMFIPGINIADGNNNLTDDNGHGTEMASVLASIYPYIDILVIKMRAKLSHALEAIEYAIDVANSRDAKLVINCSFGSGLQAWIDAYNGDEEKAKDRLARYNEDFSRLAQEAIIVAAVGNHNSTDVAYPARFTDVVSVGSTYSDSAIANDSNYGSLVDIYAPADSPVFSKGGNWLSYTFGKTSQAAVMVSALAALILVENSDLSYEEVTNIIKHVDTTSSISTGIKSGRLINFFDTIEYTRENYAGIEDEEENLLGVAVDPVISINQTPSNINPSIFD